MPTDDTTGEVATTSGSGGRPLTAAEERRNRHEGTTDPEVLADDIEKTREELAETLDAIVDRVSPKKVARRTTKKAGEAAKEGIHDAAEIVKETAANAAEVVKDRTSVAAEAVKGAAATVKEKVGGGTSAEPGRSPLAPATSVELSSASPVSGADSTAAATGALAAGAAGNDDAPGGSAGGASSRVVRSSSTTSTGGPEGSSPLPAGTVSVDAGPVPPAEPGAEEVGTSATGSASERSEATTTGASSSTGPDLPSYRPVAVRPPSAVSLPPSRVPVFAGAAAALAVVLLVLRRRR